MQVGQEKLFRYIHFNRHYNTLLIEYNTKLINQLRTEIEKAKATQPSTQLEVESDQPQSGQSKPKNYQVPTNKFKSRNASAPIFFLPIYLSPGAQVTLVQKQVGNPSTATTTTTPVSVKVLVRKEVGNLANYFDKTFAEYQEGFSANGLSKQSGSNDN